MPLVGGDGEGHALPNDGRRAAASIGSLLVRPDAGTAQEPTLGCPGPCIPHCLCSWSSHPGFHPGLPTGRPVSGGVFVTAGSLGWALAGLRVRDDPGLPQGSDRLLERSQAEGEPNSPMRVGRMPTGRNSQSATEALRQWLTRKKSFSVGPPLTGKQVGLLLPMSGSQPEVRGARAGIHSSSGVTFQSPAMPQRTFPRPATWPKTSFQRASWFFHRSGVPWGHP